MNQAAAGLRSVHAGRIPTEDELEAVRQLDALCPRYLRMRGSLTRRVRLRPLLVVDDHVIGTNDVALAVEHGGHPVGRAVRCYAVPVQLQVLSPACPQARIGRVRVGGDVSVELVKVRLAGLAGKQDRVVIGELTRAADEAEGADDIGRAGAGNPRPGLQIAVLTSKLDAIAARPASVGLGSPVPGAGAGVGAGAGAGAGAEEQG